MILDFDLVLPYMRNAILRKLITAIIAVPVLFFVIIFGITLGAVAGVIEAGDGAFGSLRNCWRGNDV